MLHLQKIILLFICYELYCCEYILLMKIYVFKTQFILTLYLLYCKRKACGKKKKVFVTRDQNV